MKMKILAIIALFQIFCAGEVNAQWTPTSDPAVIWPVSPVNSIFIPGYIYTDKVYGKENDLRLRADMTNTTGVNSSQLTVMGEGGFVLDFKRDYDFWWVYWMRNNTTAKTLQAIDGEGRMLLGHNVIDWGLSLLNTPITDYRLFVENGILTEKLKVAWLYGTHWPDYVFADNYELMPLSELESFVKTNKHLPDVPSADEIKKNGIDVATMDGQLLKKVEELTLYVIQQQKQLEKQQQEIEALKSKN